ncbi:GntR family transcriptional regulator [Bacteroidota bacterium]
MSNEYGVKFRAIKNSDVAKYTQVVNAICQAIETNALKMGDVLPSVSVYSEVYKVSRDTVFKAYTILRNEGLIKSIPNKGYFVAQNRIKILLLLNTFKAYKEVLYHSLLNNLPNNIVIDLQFHHYNVNNFKTMLDTNYGEYYKYLVIGFDHPDVIKALAKIDNDKLLLLDWDIVAKEKNNFVAQDFGQSFYNCLEEALHLFKKYQGINFIYPEFTYHPKESVGYFVKFCEAHGIQHTIITNSKEFIVEKGMAYISVNDRMLCEFLNQCRLLNLEPGTDVGILSYNETPMKKFIYKGISVISTDFYELGAKAADFITGEKVIQSYVPTKLILRDSL